ncbi:cation channel sperm-associated auxiliary subunit delta-like isoform X2 [Lineus longissimus]|uniref:cation channel sperm-associated auxiliary subunit delta-like isoform X2 n=1 Tax=Lineus longissimus TaxID=88925 RepID=UPI00315D339A
MQSANFFLVGAVSIILPLYSLQQNSCPSGPVNHVIVESVPIESEIDDHGHISEEHVTVPLNTSVSYPILLHHDCIDDLTLFVGKDGVFISKDNFKTVAKTEQVAAEDYFEPVTRAVLVNNHTLFIAGGKVVVYDVYKKSVKLANGIHDDEEVTDISSFHCCAQTTQWCSDLSNVVLAYNRHENVSEFFLSVDGGLTFTEKPLPNEFSGRIYGVIVTIAYQSIRILIKTGNKASVLVSGYAGTLPTLSITPFRVMGDDINMVQVNSAYGSLLIWDEHVLYFTPNAGQTAMEVVLHQHEKSNSSYFFEEGETIRQIISTSDGNFAFLTTEMNLFYGREGFTTEAIKIFDHGKDISDETTIAFTDNGDLLILTPSNTINIHPVFQTQTIYIKDVVNRFRPQLKNCPLQILSGDHHQDVLYLDNGEDLALQAQLTRTRVENKIIISATNPGVVAVKTVYTKKSQHNEFTDSFKTTLTQKATQLEQHAAGGLTSIRTCSVKSSLTCNKNPELVTHVSVGCRPTKSIRVRQARTRCDIMKNFTYTIPADKYDPNYMDGKATKPKTLTYDYALLGCPLTVFHMESIIPTVDLYDGNKFLSEVKADYVVYEIHGRNTYNFTVKHADINCLRKPQTWRDMRLKRPGLDPGLHWNRMNYCGCNSTADCHDHVEEEGEEGEDGHGHGEEEKEEEEEEAEEEEDGHGHGHKRKKRVHSTKTGKSEKENKRALQSKTVTKSQPGTKSQSKRVVTKKRKIRSHTKSSALNKLKRKRSIEKTSGRRGLRKVGKSRTGKTSGRRGLGKVGKSRTGKTGGRRGLGKVGKSRIVKREEDDHGHEEEATTPAPAEEEHGHEEEEEEEEDEEEDGHGHAAEEASSAVEGEDHGDHARYELYETDSQIPYEILNADFPNEMTFQGHNGIYVFELIIVDASFSFCELRTKFAIEVSGASPDTQVPTLVITGGIVLVTLVAIYVIFVTMLENKRSVMKGEIESEKLKNLRIPNVAKHVIDKKEK